MSYARRVLVREHGAGMEPVTATAPRASGIVPRYRSPYEEWGGRVYGAAVNTELEATESLMRTARRERLASPASRDGERGDTHSRSTIRTGRERESWPDASEPAAAIRPASEQLPAARPDRLPSESVSMLGRDLQPSAPRILESAVHPRPVPPAAVNPAPLSLGSRTSASLSISERLAAEPSSRGEPIAIKVSQMRSAEAPDASAPRVPQTSGVQPRPRSEPLSLDRVMSPRAPDIIITIGRIELRATTDSTPSARTPATAAGRSPLAQYLHRGAKGRS